jgi:hypothetical protein
VNYLFTYAHTYYIQATHIREHTRDDGNNTVKCMSDSRRGFGLEIAFYDHLQVVTTNNYNTIALQITIVQQAKSFQSSTVVPW